MNRLKLNFSLQTAEERNQFLKDYLVQFDNLTGKELETIANYLLWGKTKSGEALGAGIDIKTRNGTWDKKEKSESLEALLENPGFNDASLQPLNEVPPTKVSRQVFSRSEARKNAPAFLLEVFENLWAQIDELDLLLNYYDLRSGKRINPPRDELLKKFTAEEQEQLKEKAGHLNQYQYLKKRHELVELRREQYTLRDSYADTVVCGQSHFYQDHKVESISFDEDVEVYPLGVINGEEASRLIFDRNFDPRALNERQLKLISDWFWRKHTDKVGIDFRNLEDVYQIFLNFYELKDQFAASQERYDVYNNSDQLLDTLKFYMDMADLTDIQREILDLKIDKVRNQDIAKQINEKYGKGYTANYISTIFRQKIIARINEAAQLHWDVIENCFYPENFKKCTSCGRELLLDSRNFVRKSRSKDGFNSKCKRCEKKERQRKKK